MPTNIGSTDWFGSGQGSKAAGSQSGVGPRPPRKSVSTNAIAGGSTRGSSKPSCRPWERGDLLCRLGTFKPSNWFGKPKEVSSLSCARRGWVNVDIDKIECEACGAHLMFPALPSSISQEVDSAGEVFADQLDSGHKEICPWKGNCCADSLVHFPPTPPSALIGGYKGRCDGLLQFQCLPVIASSAIKSMKLSRDTQIDRFLSLSPAYFCGDLGFKADGLPLSEIPREDAFYSYSHVQKLISLCGWEPRWLANVQDCEEHSAQPTKNACSFSPTGDEFHRSHFPSASNKNDKGKQIKSAEDSSCNLKSPLLDCSLCGATFRILDFLTVPRPARFGPNSIGNNDMGKKPMLTCGASAASGINGWVPDGLEKERIEDLDEAATTEEAKSLSHADVDLNLTMAGGLPSTQSVMPVMSEPLDNVGMGKDLITGQPSASEVGDHAASFESRGPSTRKRILEEGGSTVDRPQDTIQREDSVEANGENDYEVETGEFDPIKHHNTYCPWVNGNVAAAGCNSNSDSSSSSSVAVCGWQLTLDAIDTFQSLGHDPNQTMQSESAASQYKDEHLTPTEKFLTRSVSKAHGHR